MSQTIPDGRESVPFAVDPRWNSPAAFLAVQTPQERPDCEYMYRLWALSLRVGFPIGVPVPAEAYYAMEEASRLRCNMTAEQIAVERDRLVAEAFAVLDVASVRRAA